jgi:electron transfer flavoprotein beta subunit
MVMKILVCVKQVPDLEHAVLDEDAVGERLLEKFSHYKMNRFDEFAVEEAVSLKEKHPDTVVDVLTLGPDRASDVLKRAVGMGADLGIHLKIDSRPYLSPSFISFHIADYVRKKDYDLILFGSMSEDGMHGQTGPMTAAYLNRPYATQVILTEVIEEKSAIYIEREIELGAREELQLTLPAVLTIQTGINLPRYPTLTSMLRANKMSMETLQIDPHGTDLGSEDLLQITMPHKTREGHMLAGSPEEKAGEFFNILRDKSLI